MTGRPLRPGFRTLSMYARSRLEERKSIFYGTASPASSEKEAAALLARIRAEFPDASHHAYAWVIGGETRYQRYSDDGEPQGTAGMPVLDVLRKQDLENAVLIVSRYFGGTLLGAGGLVRAYGKVAALAVRTAVPVEMTLSESFRVTMGYADYDRFRHMADHAGFTLSDPSFGMDVDIPVLARAGREKELESLVADCTSGAGLILQGPMEYVPEPIALPDEDEQEDS